MKIGFTIGKFAPLHKGHEYLIKTAIDEMDIFYVIVYETNVIKIPTITRAEWIKKLYPKVNILIANNPPSKYGLDNESIEIQMQYLLGVLGIIKPTHFYSSEEYGDYVAKYMNITHRVVDKKRISIPVSASMIRDNIEANKDWVSDIVYKEIKNMKS